MSPTAFTIHPRLANGSFHLGRFLGCHVLLKNNACFPWIIVIPETSPEFRDLHQLPEHQYRQTFDLIRLLSHYLESTHQPDKINLGCIGNIVPQLHLHLVARFTSDPAWPGTVWASDAKTPYSPDALEQAVKHFQTTFQAPSETTSAL